MKKTFHQKLPFPFVQLIFTHLKAGCTGSQNQIENGTQHFQNMIVWLTNFSNTLPEQNFQKTNITLLFKKQRRIILMNGVEKRKFNQTVLIASVKQVKIGCKDKNVAFNVMRKFELVCLSGRHEKDTGRFDLILIAVDNMVT